MPVSISSRSGSRTPVGTKIAFFIITANGSQCQRNVLDPPLPRLQYDRRQVIPIQCSHQALHVPVF